MKNKTLTSSYLSALCSELAMLLDAGLTAIDSVQILQDDEPGKEGKAIMQILIDTLEMGEPLSAALKGSGLFPRYMAHMVEIGEKTGRLVQTLGALSEYYERQVRLSSTIRSSVLYPAVLLALMVVVVLILIVQVLPIFNDVFNRLGAQMSPLADSLMRFGGWLGNASAVIAVIFGAIFILAIIVWAVPSIRKSLTKGFSDRWGDRGVFGKIASSRFVFAMTLGMASGLDTAEAIDIAAAVSGGSKAIDNKHKRCSGLLSSGSTLSEALCGAGILSPQDGKMLSIGSRSGKADAAMAEIARRSDLDVQDRVGRLVGKIEPTLVIISSAIVGVILLSVMLPLMGIMTAIG
ncbi:MAG: type II secretion system F family protein [Oscillospiraceae bacterium]|nr:type II secretion system F family protein [Oscillospiraceae bacterium]